MQTFISIIEVILVVVPALLAVAFVTIAERKTMASMQRRLGPNIVGYYGLLQAFADALKLLIKEYVGPTQANLILFFLGPIITLIFSLLGYAVIPYGPGLVIGDLNLGILYMLAVSSLSTYGILLAGWSANSKYAFLGSLRSTAQLISYELILSSAILIVVLLTGNLNLTINFINQLLKKDGLCVGSFYYPHILTYNERIVLNNEAVSNKLFTEAANEVIEALESLKIKAIESTQIVWSRKYYLSTWKAKTARTRTKAKIWGKAPSRSY